MISSLANGPCGSNEICRETGARRRSAQAPRPLCQHRKPAVL